MCIRMATDNLAENSKRVQDERAHSVACTHAKCYRYTSEGFYDCLEENCVTNFLQLECKYHEKWFLLKRINEIKNKKEELKLELIEIEKRFKEIGLK